MNTKIVLSGLSILASLAIMGAATFAFFSDSETSEDNVFTSGSLDLKVDYSCYYNKLADGIPNCPFEPNTWGQTDLGPTHKFFNFSDIKPGDFGEGTISLHVLNNDAWGRLVIDQVVDAENGCTTPELVAEPTCGSNLDGELRENLTFRIWLDEGATPGFQGQDVGEGDNVKQQNEPVLVTEGTIATGGETHNIWEGLSAYRAFLGTGCDATDLDGDGQTGGPLPCQGLADDGRLVGSVNYFFGIDWTLPNIVGNDVQSDRLGADMTIQASQHRNNPSQSF